VAHQPHLRAILDAAASRGPAGFGVGSPASGIELLDTAVGALRVAAPERLGVLLQAGAAEVQLPDPGRCYYTIADRSIADDHGWSQPLDAAVRRRLPGELGRRRVHRRLRTRAPRLVDVHLGRAVHVGRARAELQTRMDEAGRALTKGVARSNDDTADRLGRALDGTAACDRDGAAVPGARTAVTGAASGTAADDDCREALSRRQSLLEDLSAQLDDMVRGVHA
jgi:hypothetical protein